MLLFNLVFLETDEDGREILNCYTHASSAIYYPNINQIILTLVSNGNEECEIFPEGVNINVTTGRINYKSRNN